MGKFRGKKKRRMVGCKEKRVIKRDWERLLEVCEKAVIGSANKLRRVKRRREGCFGYTKGGPVYLLWASFLWGKTEEGLPYWDSLEQKINIPQ